MNHPMVHLLQYLQSLLDWSSNLAKDCYLIRRQVALSRIKTTPRVLTVIEASYLLVAIVSLKDGTRPSGNMRVRHDE